MPAEGGALFKGSKGTILCGVYGGNPRIIPQKPLTHTVAEARLLTITAREMRVATQMGNQGHSGNGVRELCEMVWGGAIGQVREAHVWTRRPVWKNQGMGQPFPPELGDFSPGRQTRRLMERRVQFVRVLIGGPSGIEHELRRKSAGALVPEINKVRDCAGLLSVNDSAFEQHRTRSVASRASKTRMPV
jgi:hypothetical protein